MANVNFNNVSKAEEALRLASKDNIAFGKLFLQDDKVVSFMKFSTSPDT